VTLYHLTVFFHLLAAIVWLGGMFFFALVGAPVIRSVVEPAARATLFGALGRRFRTVGWGALAVLGGTGVWILYLRGILRAEVLLDPAWWAGPLGRALGWKLGAVVVMVTLSGIHDFVLGPRAVRWADADRTNEGRAAAAGERPAAGEKRAAAAGSTPATQRWGVHLARANVAVGLVLIYWAMRLARGG
jgi:copper resistance protein D